MVVVVGAAVVVVELVAVLVVVAAALAPRPAVPPVVVAEVVEVVEVVVVAALAACRAARRDAAAAVVEVSVGTGPDAGTVVGAVVDGAPVVVVVPRPRVLVGVVGDVVVVVGFGRGGGPVSWPGMGRQRSPPSSTRRR
jgi:hypothetical protein